MIIILRQKQISNKIWIKIKSKLLKKQRSPLICKSLLNKKYWKQRIIHKYHWRKIQVNLDQHKKIELPIYQWQIMKFKKRTQKPWITNNSLIKSIFFQFLSKMMNTELAKIAIKQSNPNINKKCSIFNQKSNNQENNFNKNWKQIKTKKSSNFRTS